VRSAYFLLAGGAVEVVELNTGAAERSFDLAFNAVRVEDVAAVELHARLLVESTCPAEDTEVVFGAGRLLLVFWHFVKAVRVQAGETFCVVLVAQTWMTTV